MSRFGLGLDVGTTAVRAAEVHGSSNPPTLVRAGQVTLPPGAVESGEVKDPDAVGEAIAELWHRAKFKTRKVTMGVANQRVLVREVSVPSLPEKELRLSLPYQVQDRIPMPVEDAVMDWAVLDEYEESGTAMVRLLVVAAHREMIERLLESVRRIKVEPVAVDLVPFALVRAVGRDGIGLGDGDAGQEAVVDIGAALTNIVVHDHGVPRFVRILPMGARQARASVMQASGASEEDAEAIIRGTNDEDAPESARSALQSWIGKLAGEIRSSLDFYKAQAHSPGAVTRVALTGGGSLIPGVVETLRQESGAEVDMAHAFQNLAMKVDAEGLPPEAEPVLATSVGLALRG